MGQYPNVHIQSQHWGGDNEKDRWWRGKLNAWKSVGIKGEGWRWWKKDKYLRESEKTPRGRGGSDVFFFLQGKIKNSWAPNLEPELWQLHVRSSVFIFSVYHTVEISLSLFPEWVFVPSPTSFFPLLVLVPFEIQPTYVRIWEPVVM